MLEISISQLPNSKLFEGYPGIGPVKLAGTISITNKRSQIPFSSPKPAIINNLYVEYFAVVKTDQIVKRGEKFFPNALRKPLKFFSHKILVINAPGTDTSAINEDESRDNVPTYGAALGNEYTLSEREVTIFPDQTVDFPFQWILSPEICSKLSASVEANKDIQLKRHGHVRYFCRAVCKLANREERSGLSGLFGTQNQGSNGSTFSTSAIPFRVVRYNRKLIQRFLKQYKNELTDQNRDAEWIPDVGTYDESYYAQLENTESSDRIHSIPVTMLPQSNINATHGGSLPNMSPLDSTQNSDFRFVSTDSDHPSELQRATTISVSPNSTGQSEFSNSVLNDSQSQPSQPQHGPRIVKEFSGSNSCADYWVGVSNNILARGGNVKIYFRLKMKEDERSKAKFRHLDIHLEEQQELGIGQIEVFNVVTDSGIVWSARASELRAGDFEKISKILINVPKFDPIRYETLEETYKPLGRSITKSRAEEAVENLSWSPISSTSKRIYVGYSKSGLNPSGRSGDRIKVSHCLRITFVFTGAEKIELEIPITLLNPNFEDIIRVGKEYKHLVWPETVLMDDTMDPALRTRLLEEIGENVLPEYQDETAAPDYS